MIKRHVVFPAKFAPYLDLVLDGLLHRIQDNATTGDIPDGLQSDDPPEMLMTLTIERPEPVFGTPTLQLVKETAA